MLGPTVFHLSVSGYVGSPPPPPKANAQIGVEIRTKEFVKSQKFRGKMDTTIKVPRSGPTPPVLKNPTNYRHVFGTFSRSIE